MEVLDSFVYFFSMRRKCTPSRFGFRSDTRHTRSTK